ncbi:MAG TPA: hypothetical protein VIY48_02360 [Candidatus Paceibacterota bacterium]
MSAPRKLGLLAVGTSVTTVHTVAYQQQDALTQFDVCNTTAASINLNVHIIPSGGSAGTGNALCYGVSIPANGVWQWTGELIMDAGTFIQANASATGLTAHFTGRTNS